MDHVDRPAALEGLLVADFSRVLAGPFATMLLGDLGADVVKVERPGTGDDTRAWGPPYFGDESTYYLAANRNKRSVAIDLGTAAGREAARRLVLRADVVVENFKPGTMQRLGLSYEEVSATNPGLVYCTVSGFGTTGPGRLAARLRLHRPGRRRAHAHHRPRTWRADQGRCRRGRRAHRACSPRTRSLPPCIARSQHRRGPARGGRPHVLPSRRAGQPGVELCHDR